ncbi:hypothetical protein IFR05_003921 [Cadophora sp. M221]|nr:hypothetical protein IFR05_003921 [Cadophora sp. M221]
MASSHTSHGDHSVIDDTERPAATAMSRVFAIPELFEEILIQLPIRGLLLAQLVCPHWAKTITSSPPLQQKLFFTPNSPHPSKKKETGRSTDPVFNTLLASLFPTFFSHSVWDGWRHACLTFSGIYAQTWFSDELHRAKVMRADASWRRMYPMQPARPVGRLEMWGGCQCGGSAMEVWGVREKFLGRQSGQEREGGGSGGGGARMGFLYDLIVWISDEWPAVEFWVDLGVPELDDVESNDGLVEEEGGGGHDVGHDVEYPGAHVEAPDAAEATEAAEGEGGDEDEGFRIVIIHSQECYSSRRDAVDSSGLMICGFEEDAIEMVKAAKRNW